METTRKQKKEKKIIDVAIALYKDKDIKKVTMDEISEVANVSKMTIYKYFGDKDAMYHYIGCYILDDYEDRLKNIVSAKDEYIDQIMSYLDTMVFYVTSRDWAVCANLASLNFEFKARLDDFETTCEKLLKDLIIEGQAQKMINPDESIEMIYHYIDMGISYFKYNEKYRQKITGDEVFTKDFLQFILKNIFEDETIQLLENK